MITITASHLSGLNSMSESLQLNPYPLVGGEGIKVRGEISLTEVLERLGIDYDTEIKKIFCPDLSNALCDPLFGLGI